MGYVLYTDTNKGFLVLVGFQSMSGRTDYGCSGARPQTKTGYNVCNGKTDKPQKLKLHWEGKAGVPTSITFSSTTTCVQGAKLTIDSKNNELVLDAASCFGSDRTLPGIYPAMHPSMQPANQPTKQTAIHPYIHTSIQPSIYPVMHPSMQPAN